MATDFISREAALNIVCSDDCEDCPDGGCDMYRRLKRLPAADVRPVAEIPDAVDEVLDFLNEKYNCMPYHIYSALFDLVSGICPNCGADMREGRK